MKYPSSWWGGKWREAMPSGNGTLGAAVYGGVHEETVLLTHEDLWHCTKTLEMPDVSDRLPEVRALLEAQDVHKAQFVLQDALLEAGYDPQIGVPLPLGDLKIRMPVHTGFKKYSRSLDMETGEVCVSWEDNGRAYSRNLFVSRPDNAVIMEIRCDEPILELDAWLCQHDTEEPDPPTDLKKHIPDQIETDADDTGLIWYAGRNDDGSDFGAVAKVIPFSGTTIPAVQTAEGGEIYVNGAERVLIVVKMFTQSERHKAWPELKRKLDNLVMDYHDMLTPHVVAHKELFDRVKLDLGGTPDAHKLSNEELLMDAYQGDVNPAMVEKMWAFGRYLLISSSHRGGQPCPLLGKWCGEYLGFWSFHMANENLEMIYWQALSGHLAETALPLFDYFDNMMDDFRENARKLYGCRGIYIPSVTTPGSGLLKTIKPHIIHWTGAAGWIANHYFDYFQYTGDLYFLKTRAFPFLQETALFYEDFFTVDSEGYFQSAPSNSPENTPGNYWDGEGMGQHMETTMNATMDFALAKEVLTNLLKATEVLGHDESEIAKWQAMLERIPPYQINEDGAVREWMHPYFDDNYHHRHQSHIYPVFPGNEVTPTSDPELFRAFEIAIEKRLQIGISEQTGWSLVHMANVYARMKNGNQALECLNLLGRSCVTSNFYTTHNDWRDMGVGVAMYWAPFQIDANMGWSAAVQEMLLYSRVGQLGLLPALPDAWPKGHITGLIARGGVGVSIEWDVPAGKMSVELYSNGRTQSLNVAPPSCFGDARQIELQADQTEVFTFERSVSESKIEVIS